MAHERGLTRKPPGVVAELGPGGSLGIGLAALISGATTYYAFDVVRYASHSGNRAIFEELVSLFKRREAIPDDGEFPNVKPCLESYAFPSAILGDDHLEQALERGRIEALRNALLNVDQDTVRSGRISYIVPWYDAGLLAESSVDMIYSQAVLEHVDDLPFTYQALYRWLKPGGFMSHQIDFKCHRTANKWNGHWSYSRLVWKLIRGNRPYLINREPHSTHIGLLEEFGFELARDITIKDTSGIKRAELAPEFRDISDDDLVTSGAFMQAVKRK